MYTFTFNINKNSTQSGANIPLKIRYYEDAKKRVQIDTGIKIAKRHWSESKKRLKNSGEIPFEYAEFERLEFLANQIIDHYKKSKIPLTCKKFKSHFLNENLVELNDSVEGVFAELDKFIEKKKLAVVSDVIKDYKTLKKHLKAYEEYEETTLSFKSFNYDFYHSWTDFLAYNYERRDGQIGLKNNSVGKSIKNLKSFLRYSIESKRIEPIDLTVFKGIQEEVDHIYLRQEEIDKIAEVDCMDDEELKMVQDFFIIACYTGLRYSDTVRIKPQYIDGDLLYLKQKKTSGRVVVPLRPPALETLKRYNYYSPQVSSYVFNKRIKELGKEAKLNDLVELEHKKGSVKDVKTFKKYKLISSHTCRRSFCTNEYLKGSDIQLIMKVSGHKTEEAFRRYLKISSLEAALKLKEAWGM
jgi:integrase